MRKALNKMKTQVTAVARQKALHLFGDTVCKVHYDTK